MADNPEEPKMTASQWAALAAAQSTPAAPAPTATPAAALDVGAVVSQAVAATLAALGHNKPGTGVASAPSQPAFATSAPSPMPTIAPVGSSSPTSLVADKLGMSEDMMRAHLRSKNYNPHNRYHPDSRRALREVAEEGRRLMESVTILPPERGKDR